MALDPVHAYQLLGLAPGASPDEVKTAYRDLAQVWHPDRFPENDRLRAKALHNQQLLNEAYALLRDYNPTPPPTTPPGAYRPPRTVARPHRMSLAYSMFTGATAMRHSLKVLWPSATYARKRRRRSVPRNWLLIGAMALLAMAASVAALWWEGLLDF